MKRWLFNLAAVLSRLVSLAAAAAWAMSYARPPGWHPRQPARAGIDPYRRFIERERDDNVGTVRLETK